MTGRGRGKNVPNRNKEVVRKGFNGEHRHILLKAMGKQVQSCQNVAEHDNNDQMLEQMDHDLRVQRVERESEGILTPEIRDVQMSSGRRKKLNNLTDRMNVVGQEIQVGTSPSTRQENANSNQLADEVVENHRNGESAHSAVGCSTPFGEATSNVKKRGDRGKFKSYVVDMKLRGRKSKLEIHIPEHIERAIGENARHFVNECGRVVRTRAPLNVETFKEAFNIAGEIMWKEIEGKFEIKDTSSAHKLQGFAIDTMQRLYRLWKARLHAYYKHKATGANDEERAKNPPPDMPQEQWEYCVKRFGSSKFKEISERNSKNRKSSNWKKHTTGPISFAEVEDILTQQNNGEKPTADVCWLVEHTKKDSSGAIQWADQGSKEIHDQLKLAVVTHGDSKTQEEILLDVLKPRSGYFRGKGTTLRGYNKGKHVLVQQEQQKKIGEQEERIRELQESQGFTQKQVEEQKEQMNQQKEQLEEKIEQMEQQNQHLQQQLQQQKEDMQAFEILKQDLIERFASK